MSLNFFRREFLSRAMQIYIKKFICYFHYFQNNYKSFESNKKQVFDCIEQIVLYL